MRFGNILALCAFTLLAGCATGGARYADVNVGAPKLAPDRGRVYFYRTSILGFAIQPDIKLNGQSVGSAAPGGFFFVDRARGNYEASSATEVESMAVIGETRGKDVLLVDDLTETAGTLTQAAALIKKKGARRILACVSHAVLNEVGIERLRKSAIDELVTTDTVLRPAISGVNITTLSVAGLLGEAIKRIHSNSSVTSLFEFKGGRTS